MPSIAIDVRDLHGGPARHHGSAAATRKLTARVHRFSQVLTAALGEENIRKGTAVAGNGPDFIWAFESIHKPRLFVNDEPLVSCVKSRKRICGFTWASYALGTPTSFTTWWTVLRQAARYHTELFAYFLKKLDYLPDGDGTLLDHSMIMYGSALSDGNRHTTCPRFWRAELVAVFVRPATSVIPDQTPMSNLFIAILDKVGVPVESFGDSNGQLGYLSEL